MESNMGWGSYYGFRTYVPVAKKKKNAVHHAAQLAKKQGREPAPVKLEGRKIATTFWGKAWCQNLEAYSDYANRLPRGATYLRNGSVVDLVIKPRSIEALVAGSDTYQIKIDIDGLAKATWKKIKQECSASIESLLDLLAGRFSDGVMQRLTRQKEGLFPSPREIKMNCSCPDYSYCCKHLAAVMYGVGARLDKQPELLFVLRDVDHQELVSQAVAEGNLEKELSGSEGHNTLAGEDLGAIFGIELDTASPAPVPTRSKSKPKRELAPKPSTRKTSAAKKPVAKKPAAKRSTARPNTVAKKTATKTATKTRTKRANAKPVA
jgi:uncharacterized Zn finger protein